MKTMKRILCLVLVVMALAAILAIPASADAVVARWAIYPCDCGGSMYRTSYNSKTGKTVYTCDTCGATMVLYE